jgi:hypothetical protein
LGDQDRLAVWPVERHILYIISYKQEYKYGTLANHLKPRDVDTPEEKGKCRAATEASTSAKAPSRTIYTAMSCNALLAKGGLTDKF